MKTVKRIKPKFTHNKLALTISSLLLMSTNVLAEEAAAAADEAKPAGIEVIEVTARKKVESIQNVPMSVNALTGDHIQQMGINDIEGLSQFVPGLEQPKLALQSRLALRGVSSGDNTSFEQSVGTYVDGIYRGRMNQQRAGFFDMERVEVLKGPQVTLYGNSSIGGAISMITKRPELDSEVTGDVTVKYGVNYEQGQILGGVNIPVGDDFAIRVAGKYRDQSKGVAFNNYSAILDYVPQATDDAVRIGAYWEPTSELSLYLRYEQGNFETDGSNLDPLMHLNPDFSDKIDSPLIGLGMGDDELNIGNGAPFTNGLDNILAETEEAMLEVVYEINDGITFTSITGISNFDFRQVADVDVTPYSIIDTATDETYEQVSQEFRVDIDVNDKLDIIVGTYYQEDDFRNDYYADFNIPFILSLKTGLPSDVLATMISPFSRHAILDQNTKQAAVFTQIDYALTEQLQFTVGARYVESEKTASQSITLGDMDHVDDPTMGGIRDFGWLVGQPPGVVYAPDYYMGYQLVAPGSAPHAFDDLVREEDHAMFQASLRYQLDDNTMLYGSWANGAKAGGFDLLYEGTNRDDVEFEDEEANAFEIGIKKDWDNVRLNVAAFYGQYDNLQVSVFNGSVGFNVGNAASSIQQGIDAELTWVATDSLIFTANAEYLDFTYDDFDDAACSFSEDPLGEKTSCDWSGRTLPWVPEFKAVIGAEHLYEFGDYELNNMLSVSYKSEHTTSSDNDVMSMQDGYALVTYRMSLISLNDNWHVGLTIENLFDKDYETFISKVPLNNGAFAHALTEGREFTLEVGYTF